MKLKIPYYKQKNSYYCGPASLQMVFGYFGEHFTQNELAKIAKTNSRHGTTHQNMIKAVAKIGFCCYVNSHSSFVEIKRFLKMGLPVITYFIEPSEEEIHYAVVSGFDRKSVILNDSWNGYKFILPRREFIRRWQKTPGQGDKWIMVIAPTAKDLEGIRVKK